MKRTTIFGALTSLVASGLILWLPQPASAAGQELRVVQHNVTGTQDKNNGKVEAMNWTLGQIRERTAHVVTLQEICLAQVNHIARSLGSGYQAAFSPRRLQFNDADLPNDNSRGCEEAVDPGRPPSVRLVGYAGNSPHPWDYGAAVLIKSTEFKQAFAVQLPDIKGVDAGLNTAPCISAILAGSDVSTLGNTTACSIKAGGTDEQKRDSIANLRKAVDPLALSTRNDPTGRPVVIGGDFNFHPHETEMSQMYSDKTRGGNSAGTGYFVEADETEKTNKCGANTRCRDGEATHNVSKVQTKPAPVRNKKYDYIFFSDARCPASFDANSPVGDAIDSSQNRSDHTLLFGSVGYVKRAENTTC